MRSNHQDLIQQAKNSLGKGKNNTVNRDASRVLRRILSGKRVKDAYRRETNDGDDLVTLMRKMAE